MHASVMLWPYVERRRSTEVLPSLDQETLDHRADDAALAIGDLLGDVVRDDGLTAEVADCCCRGWRRRPVAAASFESLSRSSTCWMQPAS